MHEGKRAIFSQVWPFRVNMRDRDGDDADSSEPARRAWNPNRLRLVRVAFEFVEKAYREFRLEGTFSTPVLDTLELCSKQTVQIEGTPP